MNPFLKPEHPVEGIQTIYKPLKTMLWQSGHEGTKAGVDVSTSYNADEMRVAEAMLELDEVNVVGGPSKTSNLGKRATENVSSARRMKRKRRN